jgi:hypothetical protein
MARTMRRGSGGRHRVGGKKTMRVADRVSSDSRRMCTVRHVSLTNARVLVVIPVDAIIIGHKAAVR